MSHSHSTRRGADSQTPLPPEGLPASPADRTSWIPQIRDPGDRPKRLAFIGPGRPGAGRQISRSSRVARVARETAVKIASKRHEWKDAFALVAMNYQKAGYEAPYSSKVRFTPYHALPDTVTLVAKRAERVVMTFSLVPDNTLLGLPLESIFKDEVKQLRRERRRLAEVISLAADSDVQTREFRHIFVALIKLSIHYHLSRGGDTWVITVNPRHRDFYTKALGFAPLGALGTARTYAAVLDHPAEAYYMDLELLKSQAPKTYREIFDDPPPAEALVAPRMLPQIVRYLQSQSSTASAEKIRETFKFDRYFSNPRRW
jgi:hypothetical protein